MKKYFDVALLVAGVGVVDGRTNRSVVATGDGLFEGFGRTIDPVPEQKKERDEEKILNRYIIYYFEMNHFV
jgi:hypothetical protein